MRRLTWTLLAAGALAYLVWNPIAVEAQEVRIGPLRITAGQSNPYTPGGFYSPYGYSGNYGRGYYGTPYSRYYYYGRGGHDETPHWHRDVTPYGESRWYGRGLHDDLPHEHRVTPYSYRGRVYQPWGYTESIYPRYPYTYAPW